MRLSWIVPAAGLTLLSAVSAGSYPPDVVDTLQASSIPKLRKHLEEKPAKGGCTLQNASVRREWSNLSLKERQAYHAAVHCLRSKPPITNLAEVPGVRSRADDFVATHINQTLSIHFTANFLSWHRYYIWAYEKALREECGYQGYQPYWNWGRYAADPVHSELFDGGPGSMGGNGAYYNYSGIEIPDQPPGSGLIPPARGGGCVTSGPFANITVNLGPIAPIFDNIPKNPREDGLGYNPRCLRRDVNHHSSAVTHANYTFDLITTSPNIRWFQNVLQGQHPLDRYLEGKWGLHAGGHFTNGGDPGGDFFASSGDPVFYLHHAMIDRIWWIWQLQDLETRQSAVAGTLTMSDNPPSREGTLDDPIDMGVNGGPLPLGDLLSTMGGAKGGFCYIYE